MNQYSWDATKNEKLIAGRGISFEKAVFAIENGKLLDTVDHPNTTRYKHQRMFVIEYEGYVYLVPFVQNNEAIFLKTIIPSRKAARKYKGGNQDEIIQTG